MIWRTKTKGRRMPNEVLEKYIIGFDISENDEPTLVVAEHIEGQGMQITNTIQGKDVLTIHDMLFKKENKK